VVIPITRHRHDRLHDRLARVLSEPGRSVESVAGAEPTDDHDAALALLQVHEMHLGPLPSVCAGRNLQHHPTIAELKWRLEGAYLARLADHDADRLWDVPDDPVDALRAIQAVDRVPPVYRWLAENATAGQVRRFLELEGGPDGGFDDLVALCQLGVEGEAKVELARNYWDELGGGDPARVHTELHRTMATSLGLRCVPLVDLPLAALERVLLGTTLATNRWLQPEMVGALGVIELQAGPRCRKVVEALRRTGAPPESIPFYDEHARVDPHHGRAWLDRVVAPLVGAHPDLGWRVVRGARWRSTVNARFLEAVLPMLGEDAHRSTAEGTPA
jgi:hypothetical protein